MSNKDLTEITMDPMTMLGEHLQWHSLHSIWGEDSRRWLREGEDMKLELERALADLEKHRRELTEHVDSIKLHEDRLLEHDHLLHEGARPVDLGQPHQALRVQHAQQYNLHEQLKRRHHAVLAHVATLARALGQ